jgi:hypothetical protein
MSFGKKVKRSKKVKHENTDKVRGSRTVLNSAIHDFTVTKAYILTTQSGANFAKVELTSEAGTMLRFDECFQSGDAKDNAIFYTDKKTGEDKELPGYTMTNELLVAVLGEDMVFEDSDGDDFIGDMFDLLEEEGIEEKSIPLYNFKKGKEVPTKVPVMTAIIGGTVSAGVLDTFMDIPAKSPNGKIIYTDGKAEPSGKYYRGNKISKFFNTESGMTYDEFADQADEPKFCDEWVKAHKDKVYDYTINNIAPVKDGKITDAKDSSGTSSNSSSDNSVKKMFKKKK